MTKSVFRGLALWASMALALYGAGAFIAWNPNPGEWNESGRFMLAMLWIFSAVVCIPMTVLGEDA